MNRYRVDVEIVDPESLFSDTVTTVTTSAHVLAQTKDEARYAAFDMLTELGDKVTQILGVAFEEGV